MDLTRYDNLQRQIAEYAGRNRFDICFDSLRELAGHPAAKSYGTGIDTLEARFFYMLRYLMGAPADADVKAEKNATRDAIVRMADSMIYDIHAADDPSLFWSTVRFVRMRPDDSLESLMADYLMEAKRLAGDVLALTDTASRKGLEQIASDIFNLLWTDRSFDADFAQTAMAFITDSGIPLHDRRLWTAAAGLGLMHGWQPSRAEFLSTLAADADPYLSATAKVWLAMAIVRFANAEDPSVIRSFIAALDPVTASDIVDVIIEKIRSEGADALSNKYRRSMGSELNELGRRFSDATGAGSDFAARTDAAMADMPPGTFDKLKQFNEAAMAGDDVLYGTLGAMRSSSFFGKVSNWFLPFHPDHSALAPVVDTEGVALAEVLAAMPMLTDGDKYALVLSAAEAPENMRRRMLEATAGPLASLFDDADAREALEAMGDKKSTAAIFNTLVRDIFRFATRFAKAREVIGIYSTDYDVLSFFDEEIVGDRWKKAVSQLTANGSISDAISLIDMYDPMGENADALLMKARLLGMDDRRADAFLAYRDAWQSDPANREAAMGMVRYAADGVWRDDYADILEPFADEAGDDAEFLELAGMARFYSDDFEGVARYFHQLDFMTPGGNARARRLLGSALLAEGKYDEAAAALAEVAPGTEEVELIVDYGMALWLSGRRSEALDALMPIFSFIDSDITTFARELRHRRSYYPASAAIHSADTDLLPAAMHYRLTNSRLGHL